MSTPARSRTEAAIFRRNSGNSVAGSVGRAGLEPAGEMLRLQRSAVAAAPPTLGVIAGY